MHHAGGHKNPSALPTACSNQAFRCPGRIPGSAKVPLIFQRFNLTLLLLHPNSETEKVWRIILLFTPAIVLHIQ